MRNKPLILIVDDENSFLEIISAKLSSSGYDTAIAHSGKEGREQAQKFMPDLILMDIHMPNESGTDTALSIKQNPATKNLRIAFLTSLQDPWPNVKGDHKILSQALGMEDFLEKTDDLDSIVAKIKEILSRASKK